MKIKKATWRLNLRAEHTEVDGNFVSSHMAVNNSNTAFLPNLQLTQKFSKADTTILLYDERLQRPFIRSLNPVVNNSHSLNISFGNPLLEPQTIHKISCQHRFVKGSFFGGITWTGAYTNDMIVRHSVFDGTTGITSTTSANLGKSRQLSANANMNTKLNRNWNLNINSELRHNRIEKKVIPYPVYEGFGSSFTVNNYYKIGKKVTISANAGFLKLPVNVRVENGRQYSYGSGLAFRLFEEKVTAALNYANFFDRYFDNKRIISDFNF